VIFIEQNLGAALGAECATCALPSAASRRVFARGVGSSPEVELILPAELEACPAERVVAELRSGMALARSGGVGGDL